MALVASMDAWGVEAIVNLDGMWGDELEANLDRYDRAHPGRFATFAQWDRRWFELDAWDEIAAQLRDAFDRGARGLKVWKDLGLHLRDGAGSLVMPDDRRLEPVWDAVAAAGVPVTIHVADPVAFFEPMDARNERVEELLANPDWWFGDRDRFPSFAAIIEALEALVSRRSDVTWIGAHVLCYAEDIAWIGRMLDTYPNVYADVAARIAELGRVPRATRELLVRHPDRFLFGTDAFPPERDGVRGASPILRDRRRALPLRRGSRGSAGSGPLDDQRTGSAVGRARGNVRGEREAPAGYLSPPGAPVDPRSGACHDVWRGRGVSVPRRPS